MHTTLTSKGQVTIPKHARDALNLAPGVEVSFAINANGELVIGAAKPERKRVKKDRFESARGIATIKWRTADLMALLRDD